MVKFFAALVLALYGAIALAAATVQSVSGAAGVVLPSGAAGPSITASQRVETGSTVSTGKDGTVVLRFDDGQIVALIEDSSIKVDDYRFNAAKPAEGNATISLLKGMMRAVTGALGRSNAQAVIVRAPQATIGIRGTDFMLATVNPLYLSVLDGSIAATNSAGAVTFGVAPGQAGFVASSTALPASIAASALPAVVTAGFAKLSVIPLGGTQATASGQGAVAGGGVAAGVVAAGAIAAAISGSNSSSSSTSTSTSTSTR